MLQLRTSSSGRIARPASGFTLQESLISLLIGGSLLTGANSLHSMLQENVKTAAANDLVTHLNLARSEAIKRHVPVTVCPSTNQASCLKPQARETHWQHGWLVFADENNNDKPDPGEVLRVREAVGSGVLIRTASSRKDVTYQPLGTAGGSTVTFALCDARGPKFARYITVSNAGRARASRTTTSTMRCQ